jgi:leucyl aminopeptidase
LQRLILSAHHDVSAPVAFGAAVAAAVNRARDLQNRPANVLTPRALAARAQELEGVSVDVLDRAGIEAAGMGAFAAVARGSDEEPRLITIRYEPPDVAGPLLGFVGKAVTFDSGGISLKPGAKMHEMKFDMSGGAAVLEGVGAIAALGLPVRVAGVIGATENLPSGRAVKPGDIVRAKSGVTIEVNNTDAEGRLVLADCIAHALDLGAERLVDLATLTGAMVVALGHTYAGLFANDEGWAGEVLAAGERTGELCWRMPLHAEYAKLIEGRYADIMNTTPERAAGSATAAEFLHRFAGDVPWAHLDVAGSAYDLGRAYVGKGGAGWGVRLLVDLARGEPAAPEVH